MFSSLDSVRQPAVVTQTSSAATVAIGGKKPLPQVPPRKSASLSSPGTAPSIAKTEPETWKMRGDKHLLRKEFGMAFPAYSQALQEALQEDKNVAAACTDMGFCYLSAELVTENPWHQRPKLDDEKWTLAAKYLAIALSLQLKQTPRDEVAIKRITSLMASVEKGFYEKECGLKDVQTNPEDYFRNKEHLDGLRKNVKDSIEKRSVQAVLREFSTEIALFGEGIFKEAYTKMGPPPCECTTGWLGSLGRDEMSLFSDLEFVKFTREDSPEYFKKLTKWFEIRVIFLRETSITGLLNRNGDSLINKGFSFDEGGNTPLGKKDQDAILIGTPEYLASKQSERDYKDDLILTNVLKDAGALNGKSELFKEYRSLVQEMLRQPSEEDPKLTTGQWRAFEMMRNHLLDFKPKMDKGKEEMPLFDIKAELYRLPSFLVSCLAYYFDVDAQSTWDKIDALVKKKALSEEGGENLKKILNIALKLRVRCHSHYERECELAYHPKLVREGVAPGDAFILSEEDAIQISKIFSVLKQLQDTFEKISKSHDFSLFARETFAEFNNVEELLYRTTTYADARQKWEKKVAVNPDDTVALQGLVEALIASRNFEEAEKYLKRIQELAQLKNDEAIFADCWNFQAEVLRAKGQHQEALGYYEKMLSRYRKGGPLFIGQLKTLCSYCLEVKVFEKAKQYADEILKLAPSSKEKHQLTMQAQFFLGKALNGLGQYQGGFVKLEEALQEAKKVYSSLFGYQYPVFKYFQAVGQAHGLLTQVQQVKDSFGTVLKKMETQYQSAFFGIAVNYQKWADTLARCGQDAEAVYEKALKIYQNNFENKKQLEKDLKKLEKTDSVSLNLSLVHSQMKEGIVACLIALCKTNPNKANEHYAHAVRLFGQKDPALKDIAEAIGPSLVQPQSVVVKAEMDPSLQFDQWMKEAEKFDSYRLHQRAKDMYEKALDYVKTHRSGEALLKAKILKGLGSACCGLKLFDEGINFYNSSKEIYLERGDRKTDFEINCNLGKVLQKNERALGAVPYLEEALAFNENKNSEEDTETTAEIHLLLCFVHLDIGDAMSVSEEKHEAKTHYLKAKEYLDKARIFYRDVGHRQFSREMVEFDKKIDLKIGGSAAAKVVAAKTGKAVLKFLI